MPSNLDPPPPSAAGDDEAGARAFAAIFRISVADADSFLDGVGIAIATAVRDTCNELQAKLRRERAAALAERDERIAAAERRLAEKDARIATLEQRLGELDQRLAQVSAVGFKGVWQRQIRYAEGCFVTRAGSIWYANRASQGVEPGGSDPATWTLAAKGGEVRPARDR